MATRLSLSLGSWTSGAGGVACSIWWTGRATGWRSGPGFRGLPCWTMAWCGPSMRPILTSLGVAGRLRLGGGYCHGLRDQRDPDWPFPSFSLSCALSLLLSVAGAELIAGSRPRPTPTGKNTPDAHQGEQHLSQEVTAGLRWIVVCHALVKVEPQLKISQVLSVNIVLIPVF